MVANDSAQHHADGGGLRPTSMMLVPATCTTIAVLGARLAAAFLPSRVSRREWAEARHPGQAT